MGRNVDRTPFGRVHQNEDIAKWPQQPLIQRLAERLWIGMDSIEPIGNLLDYKMSDIECGLKMSHFGSTTLYILGSMKQQHRHCTKP